MTDTQQKKFYEIIVKHGFEWSNFVFESLKTDNSSELKTKITYRTTDYYFLLSYDKIYEGLEAGPWMIEYSPDVDFKPVKGFLNRQKFTELLTDFENWLTNLEKELDAREFLLSLKDIQTGILSISGATISAEDNFTAEEITKIKVEINNFKSQIGPLVEGQENIILINQKLDYLIDRTKYPKIDWINILVSNLIQLSITGSAYIISHWDYVIMLKDLFYNILSILQIAILN